ncbi:maltose operon protein MalM [Neiella marina]|uniref:Maltose operon protein MalM n=2 Tax=Neiella marina TaxID=508461 RepID=A0A8J2U5R7_9GAMM|nr:maltose operon protein MalM [Neiella marina]
MLGTFSAQAYDEPSASGLVTSLSQAQSCCASIADLPFQPVELDSITDVLIDQNSPAFEFHTGKSYFAAFKLPENVPTFSVFIQSRAKNSVFSPSVLLLDANRTPVRVIPASVAQYTPAEMLDPDSLDMSFNIERSYLDNPKTEYYLVIMTTPSDMAGQTQLIHPAKTFAKRSNTVPPDIDDPIARHSPGGLVKLELRSGTVESNADFMSRVSSKVNSWFGVGESAPDSGAAGHQVSAGNAAAAASTGVPPQPIGQAIPDRSPTPGMQKQQMVRQVPVNMLAETEAFYNQLITSKVAEGDIDSAMRLVEEAERAGSKTARDSFIEAVKGLK